MICDQNLWFNLSLKKTALRNDKWNEYWMVTCDQISDCQYFQCDNHFVIRSSSAAMSQPIGVFFAGQLFYFHSLNCWMLITFFVTFSFWSKYIVIVFILHLALSSTLKYTVDIAINCSSRTDWVRDQDQNLFSHSLNLNHQHFKFATCLKDYSS